MRIAALVITLSLYSVWALGDGMSFKMVGADVEVRATEQRAIMWLRNGSWEIHIHPIFERGAGRSAWVVPFPVQPEIHQGSMDFFEQLELLTSPVFIRVCSDGSGGGFGCFFFGAAGDSGRGTPSGSGYVKVWDRGTVGELDYVVISSLEGSSLVDWLETEGFEVSEQAQTALEDFETQEVFFFAARLSADVDPDKPLNPVRFVLPEMDPPAYPLKLTRLGVPDETSLELTLWVISPDGNFVPDAHSYGRLEDYPENREEYDTALENHYSRYLPEENLALLYRQQLEQDLMVYHQACSWDGDCMSFEALGIDAPDTWCQEIEEIRNSLAWVSRFQGKLTAYNMADDLSLSTISDYVDPVFNIYQSFACDGQLATAGCLVLLGIGLLFRRRTNGHGKRRRR